MELADPKHPNADQIAFWDGAAGDKWVRYHQALDDALRPFGRAALERASPSPGERVLDVGCGCGATTLELAHRVGGKGTVTGIDISAPMLAYARRLAKSEGAGATAVFESADAETQAFTSGAYDLAFSRFGVMFFADPAAAFRNLARALAPGGRLAFVCWRDAEANPWFLAPVAVAEENGIAVERSGPDEPGPFSFAESARIEQVLAQAGFLEIACQELDLPFVLMPGADLDRVVGFVLEMQLAGALEDAGAEARERLAPALRAALAPHYGSAGLQMQAASWIVTARRP
jgi:SAM-dependent methyltransferase